VCSSDLDGNHAADEPLAQFLQVGGEGHLVVFGFRHNKKMAKGERQLTYGKKRLASVT
jgi:hypothetical protein